MSWETPSSAQGRKSVQKAEESPVAKLGGKLIVMKRTALLLLVALVAVLPTVGGPKDAPKEPAPKPLFALQLAADAGKTTKLTLRGLRLDTATEVRLQDPKSSGKVVGKGRKAAVPNLMSADAVGDSEIDVEVTLSKDIPGGIVSLTVVGPGGESAPMTLLVNDDTPRVVEKEPNDGFKQAQLIGIPQMVEGSIKQNQDVDVFRIEGKAGDRLRIEVLAARYGSPVDAMLTVYDAGGRTVATGEPVSGSRDPFVRIKLPKEGAYFISVIDSHDQGGPMFVYRLAVRREK